MKDLYLPEIFSKYSMSAESGCDKSRKSRILDDVIKRALEVICKMYVWLQVGHG